MPDQDVKVGLKVESEGEPQTFEEAATAIAGLASSAGAAEPSLDSLVSALESLGAAAEGPEEAKRAVADFAAAVRELAGAEGVDQQREAVGKAIDAWKRLGDAVPDALDKAGGAAKTYQTTLEQLQELEAKLADPLTQSLTKAETAWADLRKATEGSMSGAQSKLAETRRRIDEYRQALEAARAAGANVTGDQVQQLQRLEGEYDRAAKKIADYGDAKRRAGKDVDAARDATNKEATSINGLGDIVSQASPRWGQYLNVVQQVISAFKAGYEAGSALRDILNSMTDGALDRNIQSMLHLESVADKLVDGLDRVARAQETLANQRTLFEKLNLKGFSADVEQNAAILEKHARSAHDDAEAAAQLQAEVDKLSGSLGVSRTKLDEQAASLAKVLTAFAAQNDQLSKTDLAKIFGPQIQQILDGYAKLRTDVPPSLAAIAQSWGVTTSAVEAATKKHAAAVDELVQKLTGASKTSSAQLQEMARVTVEALSKINISGLHFDELEKVRGQVQGVIDSFTAAGQQIPDDLARIAAQVGAFQSGADLMAQACDRARLGTENLATGAIRAGESSVQMGRDVDSGRAAIEQVQPVANETQLTLDQLKAKYGEAGRQAKQSGSEIKEGSTAGADASKSFADAGAKVDDLGAKAEKAGGQVQGAGEKLSSAAKGAQELSHTEVDLSKPAAQVDALAKNAGTLATSLRAVSAALHDLSAGAGGAFGPILAELDKLIAKAREAQQAISQVTGGGAGGGAG
jgi:chromosome segregation ATPase